MKKPRDGPRKVGSEVNTICIQILNIPEGCFMLKGIVNSKGYVSNDILLIMHILYRKQAVEGSLFSFCFFLIIPKSYKLLKNAGYLLVLTVMIMKLIL